MPILDCHQHFWRYNPVEYGWIDDSMASLRRDFLPEDLAPLLRDAGVDGSIAVQARQTLAETEWLLALAANHPALRGVVGWAPLAEADVADVLDNLRGHRKLRGLRHVVQGEPDPEFLAGAAFNRGVSLACRAGLIYEILIYARQLPQAARFVDLHPDQVFVLDHVAKPDIRAGLIGPWQKGIRELARREHVYCKISGMVTEANWTEWTEQQLRPYFETVLEAFGPSRLMVGSDWPVCTVAVKYSAWWSIVRNWISALTATEQTQILGLTAEAVYKL